MANDDEPDFLALPLDTFHGDATALRDRVVALYVADEKSPRQAALAVIGRIITLYVPSTNTPRVFGPIDAIDALTPSVLKSLVARIEDIPSVWLRARVLHVAWLRKRSCQYAQAEEAVQLYIQDSNDVFDPSKWTRSMEAVSLAVRLGASLRKGPAYNAALQHVEELLHRLDKQDPLYFSERLLGLLHDHDRASVGWAKWAIECARAFPNDLRRAIEYYRVAAAHFRASGDEAGGDDAVAAVASSYEQLAAAGGALCRPGFLKMALTAYRSIPGQKQNTERLLREIREASRESVQEMKVIKGGSEDISEEMEQARHHVSVPGFFDALVRMSLLR